MRTFLRGARYCVVVLVCVCVVFMPALSQNGREMAVTIDDLPVVSRLRDKKNQKRITRLILNHVANENVPAIGFVNEHKLFKKNGRKDTFQIELLKMWVTRGLELGNHTYSHKSLHRIPLDEYKREITKGELITKELLGRSGRKIRFFRHPFLNTGLDLAIKRDLAIFLKKNGYVIAPVTIDNSDWIFARAYDIAIEKGNLKLKSRIGKAYAPYLDAKMDYWERQTSLLFGRQIRQILLLHANSINADYLDDVLKMFVQRGYRFITLERALEDKAYLLPDRFVKRAGISWLHRWALDRGRSNIVPNEPAVPKFVMEAAGIKSE